MAKLFVLSGSAIGSSFEIDGPTLIGRAKGVDVTLPEASVSREHARIAPADRQGVWRVVDLDSSNGLHVGGRRVTEALVRDGETFTLGEIELRLRDESAGTAPEQAQDGASSESDDEEELELEFEGDLDEALRTPARRADAKPAARAQQGLGPGPPRASRAGARATGERAARRSAALGSAAGGGRAAARAPAPGAVAETSGRPVLQYAKTRSGGVDLDQLAGWQKLVLAALAIALFAAIAYGAFALMSSTRANT